MDTQIMELLQRVREGDAGACQELMPLVYSELRKIAGKSETSLTLDGPVRAPKSRPPRQFNALCG